MCFGLDTDFSARRGHDRLLLLLRLVGLLHGLIDAESLHCPGCLVGFSANPRHCRLSLAGRGLLRLLFVGRHRGHGRRCRLFLLRV